MTEGIEFSLSTTSNKCQTKSEQGKERGTKKETWGLAFQFHSAIESNQIGSAGGGGGGGALVRKRIV